VFPTLKKCKLSLSDVQLTSSSVWATLYLHMYIFTESVYVQTHGNKVLEGIQDVYTDTAGTDLV